MTNMLPWNNAYWPTAVVGEADSVNSVSASACHIGEPKGVSPGQKALLHGTLWRLFEDNHIVFCFFFFILTFIYTCRFGQILWQLNAYVSEVVKRVSPADLQSSLQKVPWEQSAVFPSRYWQKGRLLVKQAFWLKITYRTFNIDLIFDHFKAHQFNFLIRPISHKNSLRQGPSGPSSLAPAPHKDNAYLLQLDTFFACLGRSMRV